MRKPDQQSRDGGQVSGPLGSARHLASSCPIFLSPSLLGPVWAESGMGWGAPIPHTGRPHTHLAMCPAPDPGTCSCQAGATTSPSPEGSELVPAVRGQGRENGIRRASLPSPLSWPVYLEAAPLLAPAIPPDQTSSPLCGEAPHSSRSPQPLAHWRRKGVVLGRASLPVPSTHMQDDGVGVHPDPWPLSSHT